MYSCGGERERERESRGQVDRWTGIEIEIERLTERMDGYVGKQMYRQLGNQMENERDGQRERERDRYTERQRQRHGDCREIEIEILEDTILDIGKEEYV